MELLMQALASDQFIKSRFQSWQESPQKSQSNHARQLIPDYASCWLCLHNQLSGMPTKSSSMLGMHIETFFTITNKFKLLTIWIVPLCAILQTFIFRKNDFSSLIFIVLIISCTPFMLFETKTYSPLRVVIVKAIKLLCPMMTTKTNHRLDELAHLVT